MHLDKYKDKPVHSPSATTSKALVSVSKLGVEFPTIGLGPKIALSDFDLEMQPGEIVGLVGESGSGKTVLARTLLGLPPTPGRINSGKVMFQGKNVLDLPENEKRKFRGNKMSMIVANPRAELDPLIPIGKQIATMLTTHRNMNARDALKAAYEMLVSVQIPDPSARMGAYPHELSGGMAQRVVIAIALICQPQFIVSDDATSGLDVTVQAQILELLRKLTREAGSSMLFITRDMAIAAHYCDRVAVIYGGQMMEIAPRQAFFVSPRHPMTIMLMAAFSHNEKLRQLWAPKIGEPVAAKGCVFSSRCVLAQEKCRQVQPPLAEISSNHGVRCFFPVER